MPEEIKFEKTIRDGKVAILVSHGFGAGWSTWASSGYEKFMAMDSSLVTFAERSAPEAEVEAYLIERFKDDEDFHQYMGGWCPSVEWLPVGTQFYIHEYDGSESLRTSDDLVWTA